jgi:signal transduction histidine kinase
VTAQKEKYSPERIYQFGLFIERTVILVIVFGIGVLLATFFLGIEIPNREFLFLLSGAVAIYTLIYHHFVYFRNPTANVAFIDSLVYSTFIFLLNIATGGLQSPLFFLYLLPIISVRLNLGSRLPIAITFYITALLLFELILQTNPDLSSANSALDSFRDHDIYTAATYMISILLVGLYIRSISIELTTEHEQYLLIERLNQELKRIDRGKDEFISIISHEIRTPLTALRGGLTLLFEGNVGNITGEQKDFVQKLINSANRLFAIAEDSLNISALEKHKFILNVEPFELPKLIEHVVNEYTPQAESKKLKLNYEQPQSTPPMAIGDPQRIETVLNNLLDNAIKFTPSGGTVTVRLRSSGSKIVTTIQDTGVGIPQEEMRNLFKKFYRVENVLNESSQGTGLGLYIVKLIMSLHGETIGVESEPGKGSSFTFTLRGITPGQEGKYKKVSNPAKQSEPVRVKV